MKFRSAFELIGPVMIGPSSSHTAGAVRIGRLVSRLFGEQAERIDVYFYGSFAQTYRGHATDVAVTAGLLGFEADDVRIRDALAHASARGVELQFHSENESPPHPNTLKIVLRKGGQSMAVSAISIGGGAVRIIEWERFPLRLSGENPALLILHRDAYGVVASVSALLAENRLNISQMEVSRVAKGQEALMIIETDQRLPRALVEKLMQAPHVLKVMLLED